eukprot:208848-Amphidinium_carterae.1
MGTPRSLSDGSATGEIPLKGRSKLFRAESCRKDRYMDPASSCQENLHMEPARMVTFEWDAPHSRCDGSVTGRLDADRRVAYRVVHHTDRIECTNTYDPRKRQRSDSSYSERDGAEVEIQDLRSQLARERRRNQELEVLAERAEHHSEMTSTISQLMNAFK